MRAEFAELLCIARAARRQGIREGRELAAVEQARAAFRLLPGGAA